MIGSDEVDWSRVIASANGGPEYDHTTDSSNGYYMIMGLSGTATGDRAQLKSFPIEPVTEDCFLRMYAYLGGVSSSINIYTRTQVGGPLTYVWSTSGSDVPIKSWIRSQVLLSSSKLFEVVVEATRGSETDGIVALDDTSFTPACVVSFSTLPGPSTEAPRTSQQTQPVRTTKTEEPTPGNVNDNKGIYIAVGVVGGVLFIILVAVLVAVFVQRRKYKSKSQGSTEGIGNPVYNETALSEFKMSSADDFPLDAATLSDKDGFTNAGFAEFGEGDA